MPQKETGCHHAQRLGALVVLEAASSLGYLGPTLERRWCVGQAGSSAVGLVAASLLARPAVLALFVAMTIGDVVTADFEKLRLWLVVLAGGEGATV
jgi:hypothetical protein